MERINPEIRAFAPSLRLRARGAMPRFLSRLAFTFVFAFVCRSAAVDEPRLLSVKGERVNLRAAPNPEAEVVGQVSTSDILVLQSEITDPWVKVTPPDSVNLWIYSKLVKDGKITANAAQVRSGASPNHHVVGRLVRDEEVVVRGQVGDWLKIAPFPTSYVWITNAYVEIKGAKGGAESANAVNVANANVANVAAETQPAVQKPTVVAPPPTTPPPTIPPPPSPPTTTQPMSVSGPTTPKPTTTTTTKAAPQPQSYPRGSLLGNGARNELVGIAKVPASRLQRNIEQGITKINRKGTLARSPSDAAHPTGFRLVSGEGAASKTVCHVLGNTKQLESLLGSRLTVEGVTYWYTGTSLPAIFAQEITRDQKR